VTGGCSLRHSRRGVHAFFTEFTIQDHHPNPKDAASRRAMIWDAAAVTATFDDADTVAALAAGVLSERP
jgi:hypothetical protein